MSKTKEPRVFMVVGTITISVNTEVRARSRAEALRIARERPVMGLCHQCAEGEERGVEWVTSGELDGEVAGVRIDEDG